VQAVTKEIDNKKPENRKALGYSNKKLCLEFWPYLRNKK